MESLLLKEEAFLAQRKGQLEASMLY